MCVCTPRSTQRLSRRHAEVAFTLTELLVVIAIIALITGLIVTTTVGLRASAQKNKTKALIARIEIALEQYKNDYGVYPPDQFTDLGFVSGDFATAPTTNEGAKCLYYALRWGKIGGQPYLEFRTEELNDAESVKFAASGVASWLQGQTVYDILDAWGGVVQYVQPGTDHTATDPSMSNNTGSFDLQSYGADGTDDSGKNDDVCNWTQ